MSQLLIPDLDEATLSRLGARAAQHGRSVEGEAKVILAQAVQSGSGAWSTTNALRDELARSGRVFPESVELLREDRER